MEITVDKQEGCSILILEGRLDAEGASILTPYIDGNTTEKEKHLIIDMSRVPYISSGGIRALNAAYKIRKSKNGQLVLAGTGEFTRKVLEVSGFTRIFPQYATVEQAIRALQETSFKGTTVCEWKILPGLPESPVIIRYHAVSDGKADLVTWGPWNEMNLSGLKTEDLMPLHLKKERYAIGIGAFGPSPEECIGNLGNMVFAGDMIAWTPPGGGAADYIMTSTDTLVEKDVPGFLREIPGVFCACSMELEGGIHEVMLVEQGTSPAKEITLGEIYSLIATRAKERGTNYNGVTAVKILAQISSCDALILEMSPAETNRPKDRSSIWSNGNIIEWFRNFREDLNSEGTLIGFGVIYDQSVTNKPDLENIAQIFPEGLPPDGPDLSSHTLGVSFKSFNWDSNSDIEREIKKLESEGEMTGVYHLTATTSIRKALLGVSYVNRLRRDDGPVIEFEEPCPEWNEQYTKITQQLHQGSKTVSLSRISGGFSGSLVFRAMVTDRSGRKQMPFVMKLGSWSMICDEVRGYTGYVERYILNSSTRLIQHRQVGESGGILYNFVGIGGPSSKLISLEDFYKSNSPAQIESAFDHLFRIVLNAWYGQPVRREIALYQEYQRPPLYEQSREYALSHFGITASDPEIELPCNLGKSANPLYFIEHIIPSRGSMITPAYSAPQHGDLNLKNVLLDQDGHMWLIDFSDTRISHNLRDIAKMETVIRTEMVSFSSDEDVCRMADRDRSITTFNDLGDIPGIEEQDLPDDMGKAFRIIRKLRYYADLVTILDKDPEQYLIALLWYT
ncbi:MAG: anti-sigma factor antagonist, partial [Methanomicrobiales archaeon]